MEEVFLLMQQSVLENLKMKNLCVKIKFFTHIFEVCEN